jgi:DNA-binding NtrC family response regulator
VLLIVEFMRREIGHDPLAGVTRLRAQVPQLPIFVFARHGDERWAARAIKAGAADYWPIHAVNIGEFTSALQPLLAPAAASGCGARARGGAPHDGAAAGTRWRSRRTSPEADQNCRRSTAC